MDLPCDERRVHEDAGSDHTAHHQHRDVEQAETRGERCSLAGGCGVVRHLQAMKNVYVKTFVVSCVPNICEASDNCPRFSCRVWGPTLVDGRTSRIVNKRSPGACRPGGYGCPFGQVRRSGSAI